MRDDENKSTDSLSMVISNQPPIVHIAGDCFIDVHFHSQDGDSESATRKILDQILAQLGALQRSEKITMATVQDVRDRVNAITAAVAAETTLDQSVLTLLTQLAGIIGGLKQQLADAIAAGADPVALQSIVEQLSAAETLMAANAAPVAAAVVENTPAAPPTP